MNAPAFKTIAQQRLEWLESLDRPLTDEESDELFRALHAVYERERRGRIVAAQRNEELKLLEKLRLESQLPSPLA